MGDLSPHFSSSEFTCHHCGQLSKYGVPDALLTVLENVRAHFGGVPVTINSGYRCPEHNAAVGGAEHSQHIEGTAADTVVAGVPAPEVYAYLDPTHEGGLGCYDSFTHIDVRGSRARWSG